MTLLITLLYILAAVLVAGGLALIYIPAGIVATGVACGLVAWMLDTDSEEPA